jgi:putative oxidoreductase
MKRLRELSGHPWLTVRLQLVLGVLFVAAALPKIIDPPSFAKMIYNYRIVPGELINISALWLPWLELFLGLALILGIWRKTAALLVGGLLVVFIAAIGFNLLRGNPIDCGCFDVAGALKTDGEKFADMWWVITRDIGMLLMVGQIAFLSRDAEATELPG